MSDSPLAVVPNSPTPEWLTNALRQSGLLASGRVLRVEKSSNAAFNSSACHLHVTYSADAPSNLPQRLFFKRNLPEEWAVRAGAREVAFYQVAATMADRLPMIPECYGAEVDATTGASWLLLRDVSETHGAPVTREQIILGAGASPDEQLIPMVEALAGLHAAWWEHPALGAGNLLVSEWLRDHAQFQMFLRQLRDDWDALCRMAGSALPASTISLCEAALAGLPSIWEPLLAEQVASRRSLTISHGDCYPSQFLCPRPDAPDGAVYLIDFQGACGDLPAMDLVFLLAAFWTPEQRRAGGREERMLHVYLDALGRHGVTGYTWNDLVAHYRISLVCMLFYPAWDAVNGSSRDYWEPKLRSLVSAAEDWRCTELFDRAG